MPDFIVLHTAQSIWCSGILFAVIHSVLASRVCKAGWYAMGVSPRAYRLIYVGIGLLTTALWLGFVSLLPDRPLYALDWPWRAGLHAVQALGLWVFLASLRPIDVPAFLGLRSFREGEEPFIERGIYRHLRHPMYAGIMLIMFASPAQSLGSLNLFLAIAAYFVIGSRFEERRMLAAHPGYADYRARVPAFLPGRGGTGQ
jgi:protein-S-isoprenylcysteine O-methyltransferase Ste14